MAVIISNKTYTCKLLRRFSRVRLCATPETAAHQAPLPLGFSRHEYWSGLPFPPPMQKVKSEKEVAQLCPTLSDPMDYSLPGSSIHGIFQARVLEWGAIAFSDICKLSSAKRSWIMALVPSTTGFGKEIAQLVKNLPTMQETLVWSLGQEDPLEKG